MTKARRNCEEADQRTPSELQALREALVKRFASKRRKPRVGLFWYYKASVLGDLYDLSEAELYGAVLGPKSDHYRFWSNIQRSVPALTDTEYEYIPRGRVLFDLDRDGFLIISSKRVISGKTSLKAIKRKFALPEDVPVFLAADLHYEMPQAVSQEEDLENEEF